ncbi:MAG: PAS domain S-box protein [Bacteroidota bacterium]|nr:PAS domain S-box protein [Bacteroidota bacterium]
MSFREDILRITTNNIKSPAFIIDQNGMLVSSNSSAAELIPTENFNGEFSSLFRNGTSKAIQQMLSESLQSNRSIKNEFDIEFFSKPAARYNLVFTPAVIDQNHSVAICTIDPAEKEQNGPGQYKLSVSNKEFAEVIQDEEILRIIDEVRSSFPFTFLGKNKIQNQINRLKEAFWIKDKENKYILVNQKFADLLGLKPLQITGKPETDFIPGHLFEFYRSISEFIGKTSNIVIREGLPFPQYLTNETYQSIEIPLCDLDNNVIAIVGIIQPVTKENLSGKSASSLASAAFSNLDLPVLVIDNSGIVKYKSNSFSGIFGLNEIQAGYDYKRYLPEEIYKEVTVFIQDELQKEKKVSSKDIFGKDIIFEVSLRKIYNSSDQPEGYLVIVEENLNKSINNNLTIDRGKMYEILLQTSPEPMFIYDVENLRFMEVNPAALEIYGYSRNEFLQMDLTDLYAPEDIQTLLNDNNSNNKEGVFTGPWRHRKKDGKSLLVEISKSSFEFKNKRAHFNIIRDVSEKNEMMKQLQLFKSAFQNTSDLLFITDSDGFITQVNEAVTEFLNISSSDLNDRPFIALLSDESRAEVSNKIFHLGIDDAVGLNIFLKRSEGKTVKSEMIATAIKDFSQKVISYSIIVKPLAGKKEEEAHVELPAQRLQTASPSNGALDPQFLSSVFHEILTPMNVILGFIQELAESIESPTEEQKEAEDIIDQNRILLLQTMESVLEYSHIEQNRVVIKPERVIFTEMLDVLQKNTKKLADLNKIEFSYGKISSSLSFETDRNRLESLISMLISISMRITKEKNVFLSAYQYDDKNCIISIKDSRNSISEYLLKNLEELFTKNEADIQRDFGASKLTIRLARRLLKLLSGKIEIVKRGGEATEFGFVFPILFSKPEEPRPENLIFKQMIEQKDKNAIEPYVETAKALSRSSDREQEDITISERFEPARKTDEPHKYYDEERQQPEEETSQTMTEPEPIVQMPPSVSKTPAASAKMSPSRIDLSQLKCLYVEDQVDSQILFRVQMKEMQKIDFAVSLESALPLLQQNSYNFIVIDINLQGEYNGLDALKIIRRLPGYEKTNIIAATAYVLAGDKEKFIATGFDGFISKPIMREKLMEVIEKLL